MKGQQSTEAVTFPVKGHFPREGLSFPLRLAFPAKLYIPLKGKEWKALRTLDSSLAHNVAPARVPGRGDREPDVG